MSESSAAISGTVSSISSLSGAVEVVANAPETVSKLFAVGERLIYGSSYIAAYAVVFPAAWVYSAIPKRNPLMRGLVEGSMDALVRAEGMFD